MNVALLKYYIELRGMNLTQFAELMGVSRSYLYARMRNPDKISRTDMKLIMQTLELPREEMFNIFFSDSLSKGNINKG